MKDKINKICTELNDGKIAVVQATEQLFDLYSFSQQRELLIDFYSNQNGGMNETNKHAIIREVDNYIE